MTISRYCTPRLLLLAVALVSSAAATMPAPAVRANAPRKWIGWGLTIAFPNQQLEALYTVYVGTDDPKPQVIAASEPLTITCEPHGTLTFDDGYAVFDGNTYFRCELPAWREALTALMPQLPELPDDVCVCEAGGGPLFVAADARLDPTLPSANPVFESEQLRVNWSVPSSGANARSKLRLSSGTYESPPLAVQSSGNRLLTGQHGPAIEAVDAQFDWLHFLDQDWEHYFTTKVVGPRMGHWTEAPSAPSRTAAAPYELGTQRAVVYIGHSPTTGANFHGALRYAVFDPGCQLPT